MVTRVSRVGGGSTTSRRRSADDGCGAPPTATRATKIEIKILKNFKKLIIICLLLCRRRRTPALRLCL